MPKPIDYEIPAGATLFEGADAMAGLANGTGRRVVSKFNGRQLVAEPGCDRDDVICAWERQRAIFFGE